VLPLLSLELLLVNLEPWFMLYPIKLQVLLLP